MPGVNEWLEKAFGDLLASKKLSDDERTLDCAIFHTHQCAEKALKAFVVFVQQPIPKTHDLGFLLTYCAKHDYEFSFLDEECKKLNPYAQDARYPNDHFRVDMPAAQRAIEMAERVFVLVKTKAFL